MLKQTGAAATSMTALARLAVCCTAFRAPGTSLAQPTLTHRLPCWWRTHAALAARTVTFATLPEHLKSSAADAPTPHCVSTAPQVSIVASATVQQAYVCTECTAAISLSSHVRGNYTSMIVSAAEAPPPTMCSGQLISTLLTT